MRRLISGNEAIATGAYEAGVGVVSSYPGTPSTEITSYMGTHKDIYSEWATNEKVAYEVALGASFAGARALTAMKHVGLNVAADPLITSSYTGVNGGLVIVVADDPGMHSSQNEQDSRHYARLSKLPMLEPADSSDCYNFVKEAFDISEEYLCPVMIRLTTRVSHGMSVVTTGQRTELSVKEYVKDASKWVMIPANARKRHEIVEKRLCRLEKVSAMFAKSFIKSTDIGIITSGLTTMHVMESFPEYSVLQLGMVWPLPIYAVKKFVSQVREVYVAEELDKIIYTELKALGVDVKLFQTPLFGELSVDTFINDRGNIDRSSQNLPARPPNLCAGCSHRGIFYAFRKLNLNVIGDIGCYTLATLAPLSSMDSCVCMGASISMNHGFNKVIDSNKNPTVSVIGDSTFMHTGINSLLNSVYNKSNSTVVILDNSITGMTGHQPNPTSGYTHSGDLSLPVDIGKICEAIGIKDIFYVDPIDFKVCIDVLHAAMETQGVSVVIAKRPCVFIQKNITTRYEVKNSKCSGCRACIKTGCPAIKYNDDYKKAVISEEYCKGCGLCKNICNLEAIEAVKYAN